ncbi:MAG: helix-turn-helix domain-containing protein [Baekduiaceae bacterium]
MKAQTRQVLELLRLRGADGLTPAEARDAIACDRLAARVWELRHQHGIEVEDVRERSPMGATFARYYLVTRPTFRPITGVQEALL